MRAWEDFLLYQEKELGKETVQKWLRPLKLLRFDACNLYLEASDSFKALWFEEHMRSKVQKGLFNNNHKPIKVHLTIASHLETKRTTKNTPPLSITTANSPFLLHFDELDRYATFENFFVSQNNILAHKLISEGCKEQTISSFNPIYLYGRMGTGKTHLMMAAASLMRQQGKKALYVRAETFTEHVVEAIRKTEMQTFRKAYRGVDALLIDDIEILSRKTATQEEFFHTFNTLHVEGKQIILSASLPPGDLKFIEPRLVSRFEWGIVTLLQMPTPEEMEQILEQRAQTRNFMLDKNLSSFLLEKFGGNTKTLAKAFDALILRTHLNQGLGKHSSLSIKTAHHILKDLIAEEEKALLTPVKIIQAAAEHFGIRIDDILGKSQTRECTLPRQIAMYLCREQLKIPFMKIGEIFSRDHSTVITAVKLVQKGLDSKTSDFSNPLNTIIKLIDSHR